MGIEVVWRAFRHVFIYCVTNYAGTSICRYKQETMNRHLKYSYFTIVRLSCVDKHVQLE